MRGETEKRRQVAAFRPLKQPLPIIAGLYLYNHKRATAFAGAEAGSAIEGWVRRSDGVLDVRFLPLIPTA